MHWAKRGELTRLVRETFCALARQGKVPALPAAHVTARPYQRRGVLADPGGHQPAVKAAVDGLVDAGVLRDDAGPYVASLSHLPPLRASGATDELELTLRVPRRPTRRARANARPERANARGEG